VAHVDSLRAAMPADEFDSARAEGQGWDIDEALRRAQSKPAANAGMLTGHSAVDPDRQHVV
jgi:hypothetical protein